MHIQLAQHTVAAGIVGKSARRSSAHPAPHAKKSRLNLDPIKVCGLSLSPSPWWPRLTLTSASLTNRLTELT